MQNDAMEKAGLTCSIGYPGMNGYLSWVSNVLMTEGCLLNLSKLWSICLTDTVDKKHPTGAGWVPQPPEIIDNEPCLFHMTICCWSSIATYYCDGL